MLHRAVVPKRNIITKSVSAKTTKLIGSSIVYHYYNNALLTQVPEHTAILASQYALSMVFTTIQYKDILIDMFEKKINLKLPISIISNWLSHYFSIVSFNIPSILLEPISTTILLTVKHIYTIPALLLITPISILTPILSILNYTKLFFCYKLLKYFNNQELFVYHTVGGFVISLPILLTTSIYKLFTINEYIFMLVSSIFFYIQNKLFFEVFSKYIPGNFLFINSTIRASYLALFYIMNLIVMGIIKVF